MMKKIGNRLSEIWKEEFEPRGLEGKEKKVKGRGVSNKF